MVKFLPCIFWRRARLVVLSAFGVGVSLGTMLVSGTIGALPARSEGQRGVVGPSRVQPALEGRELWKAGHGAEMATDQIGRLQGFQVPMLRDPQGSLSSQQDSPKLGNPTPGFWEDKTSPRRAGSKEMEPDEKDGKTPRSSQTGQNGEKRKIGKDSDPPQYPAAKPPSQPPVGPEWKTLAQKVQDVLAAARQLPVTTHEFTPADLMHWALVWGCEAEAAGAGGQKVNVLAILCHNYPCAERRLLVEHEGHVAARFGYGYQTHRGEFLAVLAWARVPKDYPLQVGQEKRSVADLVQHEKLHCRAGLEQSHVLIGLSFYLENQEETTWQNNVGESWSLERLVSEELRTPMERAADGGLHRLLALSYAVQARRSYGLRWSPLFEQVEQYVGQWQRYAFARQNADGSWGPYGWDAGGGARDRLGVFRMTGLVFRWLAFSLPEEDLYNNQMFKSAKLLLELIQAGRYLQPRSRSPEEFSSFMYALAGLQLYQQRALASLRDKPPSP